MVLFPEPLAPTRAVVLLAGIDRVKSFRTGMPGREGYAKATLRSSMSPRQAAGRIPSWLSESTLDVLSMTWNSSCAAAAALPTASI